MKKFFLILFALIIIAAGAFSVSTYKYFNTEGTETEITIPPGVSAGKIAQLLKDEGVIKSTLWFKICLKFSGAAPMLRSGVFTLRKNMPASKVIWRLINDSGTKDFKVKILEGWRIEEIAEELEKNEIIKDKSAFINTAKEAGYEGFLFPSTYMLPKDMNPNDVISLMLAEYEKNIRPLMAQYQGKLTEKEILTIASIVEREAVIDAERPKIAAVYLNRVKIGKKLEADPTVQYALGYNAQEGRHWKKGLTLKDLRVDSPYNTYRYNGIPPGPIASPSVNSVKAVLNPESDFEALYFVADNETGGHIFSKNYHQHLQSIRAVRNKK